MEKPRGFFKFFGVIGSWQDLQSEVALHGQETAADPKEQESTGDPFSVGKTRVEAAKTWCCSI